MVENNHLNFNDNNKPWQAPHSPFSLEGQWQPWYDDRRDYNTNAPTYYDYLSNFNGLIKSVVDFVNELAKRDIKTNNTKSVELLKKTSWLVDGLNEIVLEANVKLSKATGNKLSIKEDGLYIDTPDITALTKKVATLESNYNSLLSKVNTLNSSLESLKARVDLLDGGGWATKEQLEELRKIIEANKNDYENADSGLRLLIANMQKRLDALDGLSGEMDTWNDKIKKLEAETLNVKNIASIAGTLVGVISNESYIKTDVVTQPVIDKKERFKVMYNSFTQRIDGRITRIERIGFDHDGLTTNGTASVDPAAWTKLGSFTLSNLEQAYNGRISYNMLYAVKNFAFRYYQNYFQNYTDALMHPWLIRLDYENGTFNIHSKGLKKIANSGDIFKPATDELYTVVTWLDDSGNEYHPAYNADGSPKELSQCVPVEKVNRGESSASLEDNMDVEEGITIIESNGKHYFSDEFEKYEHPAEVVAGE